MEKKRSQRLAVIVDIAKRELDDAARDYEKSRALLDNETDKLSSLQQYYQDCANPIPSESCTPQKMARQSSFLGQIYEAKQQQEQVIKQHAQLVEQRELDWQKKNIKYKALLEMVARVTHEENKILSRKEEKMLDDWYLQTMNMPIDQRQR